MTVHSTRVAAAALTLGIALGLSGCKTSSTAPTPEPTREAPPPTPEPETENVAPTPPVEVRPASVGQPAPHFELPDLEGGKFSLEQHKGSIVVLEWFNPQCPYVKAAHTKGSLIDTAKKLTSEGVVYVAINSGAPGKQGHGIEVNREGKTALSIEHPILLDEEGKVGRAYGATNTPHIFVIDEEGVLRYAGAVDNSPDGEGQSPEGGTLVNHLTAAVSALKEKKPVSPAQTKAYGCSVKYAK